MGRGRPRDGRPDRPAVPDPPSPPPDPARPLLTWLLAGDCRFTVVSSATGRYLRLRVRRTRRPSEALWRWFVWGHHGAEDPDTEDHIPRHWFYIGEILRAYPSQDLVIVATQRTEDAGAMVLGHVRWLCQRINLGWDGHDTPAVRLRRSVRCSRCRRPLTDADSIARGLGPECYALLQGGTLP